MDGIFYLFVFSFPSPSPALRGDVELGRVLIEAGADPNIRNRRNFSVLHNAVGKGETAFVAMLLKTSKCEINARDEFDNTPLSIAVINAKLDCVELLLTAGADVNCRDTKGGGFFIFFFPMIFFIHNSQLTTHNSQLIHFLCAFVCVELN
jgi:26S proteasome non-ATPase regulatory subunit 10